MNILLDLENVNMNNVFFTETKQNMMFDGIFTKLLYCDDFFTMYGIYINIHVHHSANSKPHIDAHTYNALMKLETNILHAYIKMKKHMQSTSMTYKLAELLKTKFQISNLQNEKTNCLKISGVWENNQTSEVGLSFKF